MCLQVGITGRNDIGFLLWDRDEKMTEEAGLGSRLKTPVLPIWITCVNGSWGVLFNPNKDLMKSYAAENRFTVQIQSQSRHCSYNNCLPGSTCTTTATRQLRRRSTPSSSLTRGTTETSANTTLSSTMTSTVSRKTRWRRQSSQSWFLDHFRSF